MDIYDKINEMYDRRTKVEMGGGIERLEKQRQKGKLTARERLHTLLDDDSFLETNPYMEHRCHYFGMEEAEAPGEGVVTGTGTINGQRVYVFAHDFTVMGGSLGEMHAKKILNMMDLAAKNDAPIIGLNDSAGARIQEGVAALNGYGEIFYRNMKYSGRIPQISVIMGPCAGGAVYSPALTDVVIMVEEISQMFITGPKVIESITGERITAEELGGARVHNEKSGNAHLIARTEEEALALVRQLLGYLNSSKDQEGNLEWQGEQHYRDSLVDLLPDQGEKPYDMKAVIREIVDEDSFTEIHAHFARNAVVGFGRIGDRAIGIIANQPKYLAGSLDIDACDKIARFVRLCNSFSVPIITLVDVTGFFPGVQEEHHGIIRHGAKVLYAYAEADVPKVTVILRKAYGGAYVALNSKALGADVVFAWPSAEIAVMGDEGAANILFHKEIEGNDDPDAARREKRKAYKERFANPYVAAGLGMVDDVIDPRETRIHLLRSLEMLGGKGCKNIKRNHGNIPL